MDSSCRAPCWLLLPSTPPTTRPCLDAAHPHRTLESCWTPLAHPHWTPESCWTRSLNLTGPRNPAGPLSLTLTGPRNPAGPRSLTLLPCAGCPYPLLLSPVQVAQEPDTVQLIDLLLTEAQGSEIYMVLPERLGLQDNDTCTYAGTWSWDDSCPPPAPSLPQHTLTYQLQPLSSFSKVVVNLYLILRI